MATPNRRDGGGTSVKSSTSKSDFDMEELSRVRQRPTRSEMTEVPSEEEMMNAVGKLRNGKAGGENRAFCQKWLKLPVVKRSL